MVAFVDKCPNCGNEGAVLRTECCIVCGKEGCAECIDNLLTVRATAGLMFDWGVCSDKCFETFVKKLELAIPPDAISVADYTGDPRLPIADEKVYELLRIAVINLIGEVDKNLARNIRSITKETIKNSEATRRFRKYAHLKQAENLERTGRLEEAARIYELDQNYDKAAELRKKGRQITVERKVVSVDLNRLLEQVKNGGIVMVYRCPHCGGKLKIDKNVNMDKLRVCEHCGSEIETIDMIDFLKTALS
jgi:DNA-directed RNA polymerase subunit RPC12/RpoP